MIYLDNAATSFPKPRSVQNEVERCIKSYCGNPGRGSHTLSRISGEKVYETREKIAELFGSSSPENVFFTYNDTYALNTVIKGLLDRGDHVIISDMEHNSVYRPIAALAKKGMISYDTFDTMCLSPMRSPEGICAGIKRLIRRETKMLVVAHASNICSAALPIAQIGELCRSHRVLLVLDAAQSAGHIPINITEMKIDALCAPGHKALFGLQGSGFALLRDGLLPRGMVEGGSGVNSLLEEMPESSPERFEAGTLSVPCIASLGAGIDHINELGIEQIQQHEAALYIRLADMLSTFSDITHYAPCHVGSTLLFNIKGIPCEAAADLLDKHGICVRSGYHCSPLGHRTLGTIGTGAVRVSFSPFNTMRELDFFYSAIKSIIFEK